MDINKMTPEEFREEMTKLNAFEIAKIATGMVKARGHNVHNWNIIVYPGSGIDYYTKAVFENESELKFWCYVNDDKTIIHTGIFKDDEELKMGLSSTIDRFGSVWWFEEIENALKKQGWIKKG